MLLHHAPSFRATVYRRPPRNATFCCAKKASVFTMRLAGEGPMHCRRGIPGTRRCVTVHALPYTQSIHSRLEKVKNLFSEGEEPIDRKTPPEVAGGPGVIVRRYYFTREIFFCCTRRWLVQQPERKCGTGFTQLARAAVVFLSNGACSRCRLLLIQGKFVRHMNAERSGHVAAGAHHHMVFHDCRKDRKTVFPAEPDCCRRNTLHGS